MRAGRLDGTAERPAAAEPFELHAAPTIGLEEELMVLDPGTLDLSPRAGEFLDPDADPSVVQEMPAAQVEIVTRPCRSVEEAAEALLRGRRGLVERAEGAVRFGASGTHPFASLDAVVSDLERYRRMEDDYRQFLRRQIVFGLHVHVAVPGGAQRALAVYNAARSYLPHLVALAANGPFHAGADTTLATMRPKMQLMPRQGIPPSFASIEEWADALDWGLRVGVTRDDGQWWWDVRLHPAHGTIEFRAPDAQTRIAEALGVATVAQSLALWLDERLAAGEELAVHPTWMIEENRWLAIRDGVTGSLVDLEEDRRRPTRELLGELLDRLEPVATRLGAGKGLECARGLVERNGAMRQRAAMGQGDLKDLVAWLADTFLDPSMTVD